MSEAYTIPKTWFWTGVLAPLAIGALLGAGTVWLFSRDHRQGVTRRLNAITGPIHCLPRRRAMSGSTHELDVRNPDSAPRSEVDLLPQSRPWAMRPTTPPPALLQGSSPEFNEFHFALFVSGPNRWRYHRRVEQLRDLGSSYYHLYFTPFLMARQPSGELASINLQNWKSSEIDDFVAVVDNNYVYAIDGFIVDEEYRGMARALDKIARPKVFTGDLNMPHNLSQAMWVLDRTDPLTTLAKNVELHAAAQMKSSAAEQIPHHATYPQPKNTVNEINTLGAENEALEVSSWPRRPSPQPLSLFMEEVRLRPKPPGINDSDSEAESVV